MGSRTRHVDRPECEFGSGKARVSLDSRPRTTASSATSSSSPGPQARSRSTSPTLKLFEAWCRSRRREVKPATPETVGTDADPRHGAPAQGSGGTSTIRRAMAAITVAHWSVGLDPPTKTEAVRVALAGIRREIGTKKRQMKPLLPRRLKRIVEAKPHGLRCRRRSAPPRWVRWQRSGVRSLVAIRVADLRFKEEGLEIFIPKSKTRSRRGMDGGPAFPRSGAARHARSAIRSLRVNSFAPHPARRPVTPAVSPSSSMSTKPSRPPPSPSSSSASA